jgi:hypothetical protein
VEDGTLLISCYAPDRIYALDPLGNLDLIAEDPEHTLLSSPCNLAFAGPERDLLVASCLGRRHLPGGRLGMRGAPLNYPILSPTQS